MSIGLTSPHFVHLFVAVEVGSITSSGDTDYLPSSQVIKDRGAANVNLQHIPCPRRSFHAVTLLPLFQLRPGDGFSLEAPLSGGLELAHIVAVTPNQHVANKGQLYTVTWAPQAFDEASE
jgi:hypothetical protein